MSVVYFNGEIIAESRALVFRDRSFRCGDGAFDTARTFGPSRLATASQHEWLDGPEDKNMVSTCRLSRAELEKAWAFWDPWTTKPVT